MEPLEKEEIMLDNIQVMIIFYMGLSLCLVLFNVLYILENKRKGVFIESYKKKVKKEIEKQMELLEQQKDGQKRRTRSWIRRLKSLSWLMAYEQALKEFFDGREEELNIYLEQQKEIFISLALFYKKRDSIQQGYYAKLMAEYQVGAIKGMENLLEILISYLPEGTIYCRENVLCALYASGNEKAVLKGYLTVSNGQLFHHNKLISDGLLMFRGDKEKLARLLFQESQRFPVELRLGVIQYIRMVSPNFKKEFYEELMKDKISLEEKIAIIRYFGTHYFEPMGSVLKGYAKSVDKTDWQICAVSMSALANYPSKETISLLKQSLSNRNWYIRKNAAMSLMALGLDRKGLQDVFDGGDRYAKEILMYYLEREERGK